MTQREARSGGGSPIFGVFVLGTGIVLLLNVLGVVSWDIWRELWLWWPLALVLLGAGMLLRRVHPIVMTAVTLGAVAAAVMFSWAAAEGKINSDYRVIGTFSEPHGSASSATLDVDFGAGSLNISALPPGSDLLIDAELEDREDGVRTRVDRNGNDARVELHSQAGVRWFGPSTSRRKWDAQLNPNVEYTIDIDGGASSYNLDLRDLDAREIRLDMGASGIELTVPDRAGHTDVRINGGAASIDITVPDGIAAKIDIDSGLSSVDVDESRFPKVGPDHMSPNYDTAANRVNIVIAAGVSSINVR